jgi:uncharacterized protein (DUF1810 family)
MRRSTDECVIAVANAIDRSTAGGENRPTGMKPEARKPVNGDPFELDRFVRAQDADYERALVEISSGRKRSHWMWYIFPQFAGLGQSPASQRYAIGSLAEARAYLAHSILGPRLIACAEAALNVNDRSAHEIFGSPDDMKLRSSATLFALVSSDDSIFHRILNKYFNAIVDETTLALVRGVRLSASAEGSGETRRSALRARRR